LKILWNIVLGSGTHRNVKYWWSALALISA